MGNNFLLFKHITCNYLLMPGYMATPWHTYIFLYILLFKEYQLLQILKYSTLNGPQPGSFLHNILMIVIQVFQLLVILFSFFLTFPIIIDFSRVGSLQSIIISPYLFVPSVKILDWFIWFFHFILLVIHRILLQY